MLRSRHGIAGALLLLSSCAQPSCAQPWSSDFDGRSDQIERTTFFSRPSPWLWIVIVDDAPGDGGQRLREEISSQLNGWADAHHSWDPASFSPRHIEVLLVPSSDPTRALHPGNVAALRLHTEDATSSTAAAWESAVGQGLLSLGAEEARSPKYFDALRDWLDVLPMRSLNANKRPRPASKTANARVGYSAISTRR